jgi:hypothetical protein
VVFMRNLVGREVPVGQLQKCVICLGPYNQVFLKPISLLFVLGLTLTACVFEIRPIAQPPLISGFTINGKALDENAGPIVSAPSQLQFEVLVSSQAPLKRIDILGAKAGLGEAYTVLGSCEASPCRYEWNVTAADNGAYCIAVEAEDERGSVGSVPYKNSLAIMIPTATSAVRLGPTAALTCQ